MRVYLRSDEWQQLSGKGERDRERGGRRREGEERGARKRRSEGGSEEGGGGEKRVGATEFIGDGFHVYAVWRGGGPCPAPWMACGGQRPAKMLSSREKVRMHVTSWLSHFQSRGPPALNLWRSPLNRWASHCLGFQGQFRHTERAVMQGFRGNIQVFAVLYIYSDCRMPGHGQSARFNDAPSPPCSPEARGSQSAREGERASGGSGHSAQQQGSSQSQRRAGRSLHGAVSRSSGYRDHDGNQANNAPLGYLRHPVALRSV